MKKSDNSQIMKAMVDDIDGWVVPVVISHADVAELMSLYNSEDKYSPDAATSRVLARLVLDALKIATGQ